MTIPSAVAVSAGAVIGAGARYGLTELSSGTAMLLAINVIGSLGVGVLLGRHIERDGPIWLFAAVGLGGGFTSFSSFAVHAATALHDADWSLAVSTMVGTVVLCVVSAGIGYRLGAAQ